MQEVLKLRDEMARDIDRLHGVAITPSVAADAVELWLVRAGHVQEPLRFSFEVQEGKPLSLDRKLREAFAAIEPRTLAGAPEAGYLALLSRWNYSTWRDGEFVVFESFDDAPYRKLVNAVAGSAAGRGEALVSCAQSRRFGSDPRLLLLLLLLGSLKHCPCLPAACEAELSRRAGSFDPT